ncbi:hypothetical protein EI427_05635 [Flammeovirga pectinis]|uniref:Uncharacterized protein n=1 Tax=Flammeovirga pectinis TaxID=2494373 RepID=A0A3Q9FPD6_9BACT|nr:hypothetical protein [Flammeovirga pectinis]AZQ61733.1 hypothetical protein EI427_05635 [Flammeovirga pectinis]
MNNFKIETNLIGETLIIKDLKTDVTGFYLDPMKPYDKSKNIYLENGNLLSNGKELSKKRFIVLDRIESNNKKRYQGDYYLKLKDSNTNTNVYYLITSNTLGLSGDNVPFIVEGYLEKMKSIWIDTTLVLISDPFIIDNNKILVKGKEEIVRCDFNDLTKDSKISIVNFVIPSYYYKPSNNTFGTPKIISNKLEVLISNRNQELTVPITFIERKNNFYSESALQSKMKIDKEIEELKNKDKGDLSGIDLSNFKELDFFKTISSSDGGIYLSKLNIRNSKESEISFAILDDKFLILGKLKNSCVKEYSKCHFNYKSFFDQPDNIVEGIDYDVFSSYNKFNCKGDITLKVTDKMVEKILKKTIEAIWIEDSSGQGQTFSLKESDKEILEYFAQLYIFKKGYK